MTAKDIIQKSESNAYYIAIFLQNKSKRGYKTLLRDCIGSYQSNIIFNTPINELKNIYKSI